jgi:cytochrome c
MKFVMSLIAAAIVASPAIAAPDGAALYKERPVQPATAPRVTSR